MKSQRFTSLLAAAAVAISTAFAVSVTETSAPAANADAIIENSVQSDSAILNQATDEPDDSTPCLRPDQRDPKQAGALYAGTGDRDLLPFSPFRVTQVGCPNFDPSWRVIVMRSTQIDLIAGSQLVRSIQVGAFKGAVVSMPSLVAAVNDPSWLSYDAPTGIVEVKAALVQTAGTNLQIEAPVKTVRLVDNPILFMGGRNATATFNGVNITSWKTDGTGPDTDHVDIRPFLLYDENSTFNIVNSDVSWLGSDRSSAYGITWRRGATGQLTNSRMHNNFFGIYTYQAKNISFVNNDVFDNVLYGFDPHDDSTGLLVEGNRVFRNGSHGIIFSKRVINSVVRNNDVRDNKTNGIVMDLDSNNNLIEGNTVTNNGGDGIVMLASGNNLIRANKVSGDRIGLRFNRPGASNNLAINNTIDDSLIGAAAYYGAANNTLLSNTFTNSREVGIRFDAAGSKSINNTVENAAVGVEVRSQALIQDTTITGATRGIAVNTQGFAEIRNSSISASSTGISRQSGAQVFEEGSTFNTSNPYAGTLSGERRGNPGESARTHTFAIIGVALIVLAFLFEGFNFLRNRKYHAKLVVPAGVLNTR